MMPARFAQTNLGAIAFRRKITLLDRATVKMPQIWWQSFHQEFPFDLARHFAVVGLNVAGHNTIFSGPPSAGKPQRLRVPNVKLTFCHPEPRRKRQSGSDRGPSQL